MEIFKKVGLYLAVEMLLPGGTLLAVALYLYRRRKYFLQRLSIWRPTNRPFDANPQLSRR